MGPPTKAEEQHVWKDALSVTGQLVFLLEQHDKRDLTDNLYKVNQGTVLRVEPAAAFRGLDIKFLWNYPGTDERFDRDTFTEVPFNSANASDLFFEKKMERPGNFDFKYVVTGPTEVEDDGAVVGSSTSSEYVGTLIVEPLLELDGSKCTLASVAVHTQVPKCLGKVEEWWERMLVSSHLAFNFIHFCPIQEWGSSKSPYSIKNQHSLEPTLFGSNQQEAEEKLSAFLKRARKSKVDGGLGVDFMIDVVYNHTAINTDWLAEHPEAGYTLTTAPYLQPAYVLDRYIGYFSKLVGEGKLEFHGKRVPDVVHNEGDIHFLLDAFFGLTKEAMKLWEFFVIDVERAMGAAAEAAATVDPEESANGAASLADFIAVAPDGGRGGVSIKTNAAVAWLKQQHPTASADELLVMLRVFLEDYNLKQYRQLDDDMAAAREHLKHTLIWERLDERGPRKGAISAKTKMVYLYFFNHPLAKAHEMSSFEKCPLEGLDPAFVFVCNGWVWEQSKSDSFANRDSRAYLRREVNIWGDSVKLRYGASRDDNPWLWDYMRVYTEKMAGQFSGLRIDNCHSTPKHVGQYMMDAARNTNPSIVVFAELFTSKEETAIQYVNALGINSLLLECMSPGSAGDYSALLHRYGGTPPGTFRSLPHLPLQLRPSGPRATLLSASHDNEFPASKQSVFNSLPLSALASMVHNGVGSCRAYEELLSENLEIVNEEKLYRTWNDDATNDETVNLGSGILKSIKRINELHRELDVEGFSETYIDHIDDNCVSVLRSHPSTFDRYIAVAFMMYHDGDQHQHPRRIPPIHVTGTLASVVLNTYPENYTVAYPKNTAVAKGAVASLVQRTDFSPHELTTLQIHGDNNGGRMSFDVVLKPGEVIIFKISGPPQKASEFLASYPSNADVEQANALSVVDLNHALFRCERENESAAYVNDGVYEIPGYGKLKYAGVSGVMALVEDVVRRNDLGHALCDNIRAGNWLLEYIANHLEQRGGTAFLGETIRAFVSTLELVPVAEKPMMFTQIISKIYGLLVDSVVQRVPAFLSGSNFGRKLAVAALQFFGSDAQYSLKDGIEVRSLSAGLPHFSAGWMRCWGRDTFIALRGCLLCTTLFEEAHEMFIAFAKVVRHGLIPNLFDNGNFPRFNCRDATWFYLQALKDYCTMNPTGLSILDEQIERRFMEDEGGEPKEGTMPLHAIISEMLTKHAAGIAFREWNAGDGLDKDMTEEGFHVRVHVDQANGFVSGGSQFNCGTWMDKMGSSEKAGNKGLPATPRDGADVEIVALSYSVLRWLEDLHKQGKFGSANTVTFSDGNVWTYGHWADVIAASFEREFFIPTSKPSEGNTNASIQDNLVNRRGIYRDTVGSTHQWTDYQLRPNVAIAMAVAPELFDAEHAQSHLKIATEQLLGGMGMRTLDPSDWNYRPSYNNSDDGDDISTAHGWNYHQGPEWLWPVGYHLRALYRFGVDKDEVLHFIHRYLSRYDVHISTSAWRGLPELFNENGAECRDSCPTQAWSVGCLIDVLYDVHETASEDLEIDDEKETIV